MRIEVDLLGVVNAHADPRSPLQKRYIVRVTAEQIWQWLKFERRGNGSKNAPFKIAKSSIIRIDPDIQRGFDGEGYALQKPSKINEIADTLLDHTKAPVPRLYMGSLTWNVRPGPSTFDTLETRIEGRPSQWRLAFDTDQIFLTDSAHRHFGIAHACDRHRQEPDRYPLFNPRSEFSVDLYNLDRQREKELFSELNSKQKKISAAKQKEMDVSSPIGALKDAILQYDAINKRLFDQNIEVSSNQNDKHTLMTMSVFVGSIDKMFTRQAIEEARNDDDVREELAEFYCKFFYELQEVLRVRSPGGEELVQPFRNLYTQYIKPAEDGFDSDKPKESEERLGAARERAAKANADLRAIDVANSNSFIKALAAIGGRIRRMGNWPHVIYNLQQANVRRNHAMFQKTNPELFAKESDSDVPIASLTEQGGINVQVQSKTINTIENYLLKELDLIRNPEIYAYDPDAGIVSLVVSGGAHNWRASASGESYQSLECYFYMPSTFTEPAPHSVRLEIDGGESWRDVTRTGKTRSLEPVKCERDGDYQDRAYQGSIDKWKATFEVTLPALPAIHANGVQISATFMCPDFNNPDSARDRKKVVRHFVVR